MSLEVIALFVSIVSMVAAIVAIPSIHERVVGYSPVLAQKLRQYERYILLVTTTSTVIILLIYRQFFYPCPWYEIRALREDAARLGSSQPSITSQIGQRLCDCGEAGIGWDLQAKAEYATQQYRTAINFWRRSADADQSKIHRVNANIADASILIGDYLTARELYRKSYASNPQNDHFRYGLGRALTFSGDYAEALTMLSGMNPSFNDGGSTGQTLVFEGIARLGSFRASEKKQERDEQFSKAKASFCRAISINHNWKEWLTNAALGIGNTGGLQNFKEIIRPVGDLNCKVQE